DGSSWTQMSATGNGGLISYLKANSEGYYYLVAVPNAQQASSITLESGKPVLATAGFMGTDPALTPSKLAEMVANKLVRFVMLSGGFGPMGGTQSVSSWVQGQCSAVDTSLWQSGDDSAINSLSSPGGYRGLQLYDCAAP